MASPSLSPLHVRLARTALGLGVREAGALALVSPHTIVRIERGEILQPRTNKAIRDAFEGAGVVFIEADESGGEGVRMKAPATSKQQAR